MANAREEARAVRELRQGDRGRHVDRVLECQALSRAHRLLWRVEQGGGGVREAPVPIQIGTRFGRLVVIADAPKINSELRWRLLCDCGGIVEALSSNLRRGNTRSCGCLAREGVAARNRKHGGAALADNRKSPEYIAWQAIVQRCTNPNHKAWRNYGGRGIAICAEWRHDFAAFFAHVGPRPSSAHSIDRMDNERGYEPGNVRWVTLDVQAKNRRARERDNEGRFT